MTIAAIAIDSWTQPSIVMINRPHPAGVVPRKLDGRSPEVFILLLVVMPALTIWALVDLLRRPTSQWETAGQDRLVWALVVVFVGLVGPVLYLTIGRNQLNSASVDSAAPVVVA